MNVRENPQRRYWTTEAIYAQRNEDSRGYLEGFHMGREWADADRRDYVSAADELERLREESQSSQRWARAFYLGALRGYREVTRTLRHGKWGT